MEEKLNLTIVPKYNFIYEMGMPTGRKTKNTILSILFILAIWIIGYIFINSSGSLASYNVQGIFFKVMLIVLILFIIKLLFHIVAQIIQYKNISYNFYDSYLEYKDSFLNQQTKVLKYKNITEIEVIRNVWERINGLGIIVVYTSAEKNKKNGLVIYGIKNTQEVYKKIQEFINKVDKEYVGDNISYIKDPKSEENFKDKLKDVY